ncbi:MAG: pyridoxal phosphate-dependent aminotransferase [Clostridia bacterium]|nr:pyridoxal phosphate-dependent aminotransferase [Clostridia bacterium]
MINEKMRGLGAKRSAIRDLFEYGLGRKAAIGEDNVFDFSLGNPSVPAPNKVSEELARLISTTDPIRLHGYTSAQGDASVRAAVAAYISRTHGIDCTADDLYMTVGAAAALTCSLSATVCPGEEVILLSPYFPEYKVFVEGCGGTVREVMCDPVTFQPDVDAIAAAISERTAAIIINSPNNPTGAVFKENILKEIAEVLAAAEKKYSKDIYIIADEPYRELVYGDATVPYIPKLYHNTLVCYSYSKSLSLPGERIGYVHIPKCASNSLAVFQAVAGAGRSLGYVCAPSLLQRLIPACLGLTSDVSVYDTNRKLLLEELSSYGYTMVKPEGAFYLFLKAPVADAKEFCEAAKRHELLLVPSDSFGCGGYVRISYCVTTEQIKRALPAFRRLAEEYGLI